MLQSPAPAFAVPWFGRAWRSLACVAGGWAVMVGFLLLQYRQFAAESPHWYRMPGVFATYSLPYAGGVWLCVVLPLLLCVPHRSRVWSWYVVGPLFGLIGFLVMSGFFRFDYNHSTKRIAALAALLGAATGLCSALWQSRLRRRCLNRVTAGAVP